MTTERHATKTILLVEDEPDVVLMVRGRLTSWGYDVIAAANGQEALDLVHQRLPDLILLDLKIPILSGREMCHQLKTDQRFANIPVILVTSGNGIALEEERRAIQADDCVLKPFESAELLAKIKKWIA